MGGLACRRGHLLEVFFRLGGAIFRHLAESLRCIGGLLELVDVDAVGLAWRIDRNFARNDIQLHIGFERWAGAARKPAADWLPQARNNALRPFDAPPGE